MEKTERGYFQPEQAREVARAFSRHGVEYLFIGKGAAILLGYPAGTQDVDIFPRKNRENGERILLALADLGFTVPKKLIGHILNGSDFVQVSDGPFDLDLVFAPDGIESFDAAYERRIIVDQFPVANPIDIIASKKAAGRPKDLVDLSLLEEFGEEFQRSRRTAPKSALEIVLDKTRTDAE
ncbi:MAG TPA: hypothetical protein VNA17_09260 [Pyrinomonadaceae bacterium]|nr:hypothetical protein [Pyrinomonadaceae bacterium]